MNILTTKQVAELLGVKQQKVYQLIKGEKLPNVKLGKYYCFFEDSILKWKETYDKKEAEKEAGKCLTIKALKIASILGCSIARVYALVKNEGLPCVVERHGKSNRYFFNEEEFVIWLMGKENNKPIEEQIMEAVEPVRFAAGSNGFNVAA